MTAITLDALAFAAHCDDIEITSGGLLIKLADLGYKVGACDLTAGEMGSRGSREDRLAEAQCAAEVMGLIVRENLGLPDAGLEMRRDYLMKIVQVLRRYRPHLVILPYWIQRHPDHRLCSELAQNACFLAGLKKLEVEGEPHRPQKIIFSTYYRSEHPSFCVDISAQLERKLKAVACYKTQFDGSPQAREIFMPGVDIFDLIRTRDRNLGLYARVGYAEGYIQKEPLLIDNPMLLQVRSI